ncbi:hypothetical protein OYT13_24090 [Pandoraea sp. XJJ-1]|uniref:hypothetical protein n=1 Tax=Pandoraea sp. XJJ-1 TaxID=3002643 RepID=UPI0022807ACA|nr:hypothetical protein [Pandoraea sp. XJJ-1]WAL82777.1 hypothetical protein OYT13_24090 [Pandoraea sp. XJJ-1]
MSKRKPQEAVAGSYTPIPHAVLDSIAFTGASVRAKAMLFDVLRQHNGKNNGRLQLSVSWLRKRGWKSADQIQKAKLELLERGLVIKTRFGGLTVGPDWYALTWLPISNYDGLDLRPGAYYPGHWRMMDPPPVAKNHDASSATRNSAVPPHGIDGAPTTPPHGTVKADIAHSPIPSRGNNECCQLPPVKTHSRVVGKKGASGAKGTGAPTSAAT